MSTLPFNVPPEQWTPEYAAQILQLAQEGFARNPDLPGPVQPGIVPMGAEGSLTPPIMAPALETSKGLTAMPTPETTPQRPAAPQGPAGAGGGWHDKLQQMLPMIAAMGYGMDPKMRHMIPVALQMGQMQQQQMGQKQLADIRSNVAQLGEKGPDAVKKYLTEVVASPNLRPDVSKVAAEHLKEVTDRTHAREAVKQLTSRDPKDIMAAMPTIVENLGDERALALFKGLKLENKLQAVQAGDQMYTFDPTSGEYTEGPKATPKFNSATIGGTDVTEELVRMGLDPKEATSEQLQQAAKAVQAERRRKEEAGKSTALSAAGMQAAATKAGMIEAAKIGARPLDNARLKEVESLREVVGLAQDVEDTYDPKFTGQVAGRVGAVREFMGQPYKNETEFRQNAINLLTQRIQNVTGAAMGVEEAKRIQAGVPSVTDEPAVFQSKLKNTITQLNRTLKSKAEFTLKSQGEMSLEDLTTVPRKGKPPLSPGGRRYGN